MKKTDKSLLILLAIFVCLTILVILVMIFFLNRSYDKKYTPYEKLSDLAWPQGPTLIILNQFKETKTNGNLEPGTYVLSSDGKIKIEFDQNFDENLQTDDECLSTNELIISGKLRSNLDGQEKNNLYYISAENIISVKNDFTDKYIDNISASFNKKYLRYRVDDKLCVSSFSKNELGDCIDLNDLILEKYKNKDEYFFEGDWLKDENKYVLRVRSRIESHKEPSQAPYPNQPPLLIQDEKARFIYDAEQNNFKEISLDDEIILKPEHFFVKDGEINSSYFNKTGDYELIYGIKGSMILIKEKSTGKLAKLSDANFLGDMSTFSIDICGEDF